MSDAGVFRWLQPIAVMVGGVEGCKPDLLRPVLAVQETGGNSDPWRVRFVFLVMNDAGQLVKVTDEQISIGGVGAWLHLMNAQLARPQGRILTPEPGPGRVLPLNLKPGTS